MAYSDAALEKAKGCAMPLSTGQPNLQAVAGCALKFEVSKN